LIDGDDLHILLNQPLKVNLRSLDVLHDFYVPQFRAKMDMIPGMITYYWFTPIKTGSFEILCAEYCGTAHYAMLGTVLVDEKADYDDWLNEQMTFKEILALNKNNDLIKVASKNDQ
jgi:cytochrome c oxidase subunit 2